MPWPAPPSQHRSPHAWLSGRCALPAIPSRSAWRRATRLPTASCSGRGWRPRLDGGGMPPEAVEVRWEVAHDPRFLEVARRGLAIAAPELGHAVHVDVTGLEPDRWYHYRPSPAGRLARSAGPAPSRPAASAELDPDPLLLGEASTARAPLHRQRVARHHHPPPASSILAATTPEATGEKALHQVSTSPQAHLRLHHRTGTGTEGR